MQISWSAEDAWQKGTAGLSILMLSTRKHNPTAKQAAGDYECVVGVN